MTSVVVEIFSEGQLHKGNVPVTKGNEGANRAASSSQLNTMFDLRLVQWFTIECIEGNARRNHCLSDFLSSAVSVT